MVHIRPNEDLRVDAPLKKVNDVLYQVKDEGRNGDILLEEPHSDH